MGRKYEFTGEEKNFFGGTLHRIRVVRDFGNVKKGELGGWIEKEENLSHDGDCWVGENAWVLGNAVVEENAIVRGNALVLGNAWVGKNAWIGENACVLGDACVMGNACISKNEDYLVVGPIGSRNGFTTFYKNKDNGISVSCGCFNGTIEEFLKVVKKTHGDNKYGKSYRMASEYAKFQLGSV